MSEQIILASSFLTVDLLVPTEGIEDIFLGIMYAPEFDEDAREQEQAGNLNDQDYRMVIVDSHCIAVKNISVSGHHSLHFRSRINPSGREINDHLLSAAGAKSLYNVRRRSQC